jgi:rhodanese-related sulfurtransferase
MIVLINLIAFPLALRCGIKLNLIVACVFCQLAIPAVALSQESKFPLREEYSDIPVVSHDELYQQLGKVLVVDVRSKIEFDTLRIVNAINVSVTNKGFISQLKSIRNEDTRPIIFYCNGITCAKSYKACRVARENSIADVFTFDLGIFGWTEQHPDAAVLLGENPVPLGKLISKDKLNSHMLSPEEFEDKITNRSLVLDIREPFQRNIRILEKYTRSTPMDKISYAMEVSKRDGRPLFIYDAVGKQVRWLQYTLEKNSVPEYYFMKGGVKAYLKESSSS